VLAPSPTDILLGHGAEKARTGPSFSNDPCGTNGWTGSEVAETTKGGCPGLHATGPATGSLPKAASSMLGTLENFWISG